MKTKSLAIIGVLLFSLLVLTSAKNIQDKQTFEGVYDGKEDYGYNFIGVNEVGDEYTMTFHEIGSELLKYFDLNSEKLIGTKFSVTYTTIIETEEDEDGYEEETETNTIVALKKL